jgi:hypothetical protein
MTTKEKSKAKDQIFLSWLILLQHDYKIYESDKLSPFKLVLRILGNLKVQEDASFSVIKFVITIISF